MPYILNSRRAEVLPLSSDVVDTAGELNFQITSLIRTFINVHGLKYQTINDIIGVLESSKLEFYRRIAVPYEDEKIKTNGDVYL